MGPTSDSRGAAASVYARGVTPPRSVTAIVLGAALLALVVAAPQAQELLRVRGSVQWIAGSRMQVMTTSGSSIVVDLTQADLSSYQILRGDDSVIVTESSRLMAGDSSRLASGATRAGVVGRSRRETSSRRAPREERPEGKG